MIVKKSKTNAVIFQFEGQTDMTDYVDSGKFMECRQESGTENFGEFTGKDFSTWEELQEFTKSVWEDGLQELEMFVERLRKTEIRPIKSHKRTVVWGPTGDELDIEKLQAGDPNCWKSYAREKTDGPTSLTIIIDTSTPWHVHSADILWRGAAAIALTHILEEKGYSVELWVVAGSHLFASKPYPCVQACCLKKTSDPLDAATLVNTVAGWFYRTVTFTLMRTICAKTHETRAGGYGSVYTCNEDDLDQITPDALRIFSAGVFTFNGAVSLMEAQLGKLADDSDGL